MHSLITEHRTHNPQQAFTHSTGRPHTIFHVQQARSFKHLLLDNITLKDVKKHLQPPNRPVTNMLYRDAKKNNKKNKTAHSTTWHKGKEVKSRKPGDQESQKLQKIGLDIKSQTFY